MSVNENVDINAAFEDLLFAEDIAEKRGFEEGFIAGKNRTINGYHLGYHRASLLSAQIGYYRGVINYCLNKQIFPAKVVQQARKLFDEIKNFPVTNDENFDLLQIVENIKFKFTKLCTLAKIDPSYPEADKLDF